MSDARTAELIYPRPRDDDVQRAKREMAETLLFHSSLDARGNVEKRGTDLLHQLKQRDHSPAAIQWAIHEMVQAGLLRAEKLSWDFPDGRLGRRITPRSPVTEKKPVDYAGYAIATKADLLTWWEKATGVGEPDKEQRRRAHAERKREKDDLIVSLLNAHHNYDSGEFNFEPAKLSALVGLSMRDGKAQVSPSTLSRWFKHQFPDRGYDGYKAACRRDKIRRMLEAWNRDLPVEGSVDPHFLAGSRRDSD